MILRPDQNELLPQARAAIAAGATRLLIAAETGYGKTVLAGEIMRRCVAHGKRALFLAHMRHLIDQASDKLTAFGVEHGVIMAGRGSYAAPVQVASKDTLVARAFHSKRLTLPSADLVIVDEAHHSISKYYQLLLDVYRDSIIIGITATLRADMGQFFQGLIQAKPRSWLIENKHLVPTKVFSHYVPNLKGVKVEKGDYVRGQLAERMDKPKLVGDVVQTWRENGEDSQTVVFASSVEHSIHLRDEFRAAGVAAEHVDASTPYDERDRILAALEDCSTRIVCNVGVYTEGWDCPPVRCCVDCRPTRSLVLDRQQTGRIQRTYLGKQYAILLDHAGNVHRHGLPDDDIEWELNPSERIEAKRQREREEGKVPVPITCEVCHLVYSQEAVCPNCGHRNRRRGAPVEKRHEKLVAVNDVAANDFATLETIQRYWNKCLYVMAAKDYTTGAAAHMFKRQYQEWPPRTLANVPVGADWKRKVRDVFPQFHRRERQLEMEEVPS